MSELIRFRLQGEDRAGWSEDFVLALKNDSRTGDAKVVSASDGDGLAAADPTTVSVVIQASATVLAAAIAAFATLWASRRNRTAALPAAAPMPSPMVVVIAGSRDSVTLPIKIATDPADLAESIDAALRQTGAVQEVAIEPAW